MRTITLPNGVIKRNKLVSGRVYVVSYCCELYKDVQTGTMQAFWTGDIDTWGKLTFRPVDGSPVVYLFARELTEVEAW